MPIKYRTFQDGDESGIIKLFHSAFCETRFCQPKSRAFWDWRYKKNPYGFFPEGIMLAEKKGIIVGSVLVSFHKIRFGKKEFLFGAIDDVATCPVLQKKGIARKLMEKAIEFTINYGADGSVLMADPRGHARRLYKKLGYIYKNYYSMFFKIINPLKFKNEMFPLFPFAPLMYLMKLKIKRKKWNKYLQFELLKEAKHDFLTMLNENLKKYFGSNIYDKKYWEWFRINRPKRNKGINIAVKKNNKLIGGASIIKNYFLALKYTISQYVLTDLFIDPQLKNQSFGYAILNKLESIAALESPVMLAFIHEYDFHLNRLLKENGYFSVQNAELEMIKPISKDFIQTYKSKKDLKNPWMAPLEQSGF